MDWANLTSWSIIAALTAAFVIHRSRRKTATAKPDTIEGTLHRSYTATVSQSDLRSLIDQTMRDAGFTVHSTTDSRLIYDSNTIGLFHWGFLYIFDLPDDSTQTVTISIFGKGPNPPHRKAMQKHMDTFLRNLHGLPLEPIL